MSPRDEIEVWMGCRSDTRLETGVDVACTLPDGHDGPHGCRWAGGQVWTGGEWPVGTGLISEAQLRTNYELIDDGKS